MALFAQPDLKTRSLGTHLVLWTPPLCVENHSAYNSKGECTQLTPLSCSVNAGMQTHQEHYRLWSLLVRKGWCMRGGENSSEGKDSLQASPRGSFFLLCTDETLDQITLLMSAETAQQLSLKLDQELFRTRWLRANVLNSTQKLNRQSSQSQHTSPYLLPGCSSPL